ncbi:PolC-type DNA polymerase III N-terminal domain-containing protein, partial [Faecalicatena contorta]
MEKIGNEKIFFHVFPTLKVENDIKMLFSDVEVSKITTNSKRDFLRVHIFSRHLIQKKHIWQMEQKIKEQLFGNTRVSIRLEEQYALSEQYTASTLMMEYRESIVQELKQHSVLAASMFEQAEMHFEGSDILYLEMLNTIVSEGKREYIVDLLHEIYEKRFHIKADIRVTYREAQGEQDRQYEEQRIQQEINAIFERRAKQRGEEQAEDSAGGQREKKEGNQEKRGDSGKKGDFKKKDFKKKDFYRPLKQGDDPSLIYGRNFDDEPITLDQVVTEMGEITVHGKIINFDTREIRNDKTILMFAVTDFTDTITVKMFTRNDQLPELLGDLKKGVFVKIKGITTIDKFDGELTIGSVTGIKKSGDFTVTRKDLSQAKRVELHCHTKMSDMDGVSEVKDIVKRAHDWGHPAVAITDHGIVQSFPDANHFIETLDKDDPFKVIYGV